MRVIAGKLKGKKLKSPQGIKTRPVLEKIRGALFNVLGDVDGLKVLDLFAGTGALGIEALSRGADSAVFVDSGATQCRIIRENASFFGNSASVLQADSLKALRMLEKKGEIFDLIMADPPYGEGLAERTLERVCGSGVLARTGLVALTTGSKDPLPESMGDCHTVFDRVYSTTRLRIYRKI